MRRGQGHLGSDRLDGDRARGVVAGIDRRMEVISSVVGAAGALVSRVDGRADEGKGRGRRGAGHEPDRHRQRRRMPSHSRGSYALEVSVARVFLLMCGPQTQDGTSRLAALAPCDRSGRPRRDHTTDRLQAGRVRRDRRQLDRTAVQTHLAGHTRILAVADEVDELLYGDRLPTLKPDLVLSCGDLPFDYLEYLVSRMDVPLLYVPGNHDPSLRPPDTTWTPLRAIDLERPAPGPQGCVNIDGRLLEVRGLRIAGLGGSLRA